MESRDIIDHGVRDIPEDSILDTMEPPQLLCLVHIFLQNNEKDIYLLFPVLANHHPIFMFGKSVGEGSNP